MKIEIEVIQGSNGGKAYNVIVGEKDTGHLTFDEMLGLLVILTIPQNSPHLYWLKTKKEWDEFEERLKNIGRK